MAAAVIMAKAEKAGKEVPLHDEVMKKVSKEYSGESDSIKAYTIFKPINDGSVSKAIVAQYLAEILMSGQNDYKAIFESDPYLKYIVDSIKHVTCIEE